MSSQDHLPVRRPRFGPLGGEGWTPMTIENADHVTFAVTDTGAAIAFFEVLGFETAHVATIDGGKPATYMGDPAMHAEHVTLELTGSDPSFQVQLLRFRPPPGGPATAETRRAHEGFNHLALRVDDLAATSARLVAAGLRPLNEPMHFIGRNLQFFAGPEGITVELVERVDGT
jgi:catechol 2,3-dioxygenase-like lactoylglutathione lyase family enzyme